MLESVIAAIVVRYRREEEGSKEEGQVLGAKDVCNGIASQEHKLFSRGEGLRCASQGSDRIEVRSRLSCARGRLKAGTCHVPPVGLPVTFSTV